LKLETAMKTSWFSSPSSASSASCLIPDFLLEHENFERRHYLKRIFFSLFTFRQVLAVAFVLFTILSARHSNPVASLRESPSRAPFLSRKLRRGERKWAQYWSELLRWLQAFWVKVSGLSEPSFFREFTKYRIGWNFLWSSKMSWEGSWIWLFDKNFLNRSRSSIKLDKEVNDRRFGPQVYDIQPFEPFRDMMSIYPRGIRLSLQINW
jgi:hypothetical protein